MQKQRFMVVRTIDGVEVPSSTVRSDLTEVKANTIARKLSKDAHKSIKYVVKPEIMATNELMMFLDPMQARPV